MALYCTFKHCKWLFKSASNFSLQMVTTAKQSHLVAFDTNSYISCTNQLGLSCLTNNPYMQKIRQVSCQYVKDYFPSIFSSNQQLQYDADYRNPIDTHCYTIHSVIQFMQCLLIMRQRGIEIQGKYKPFTVFRVVLKRIAIFIIRIFDIKTNEYPIILFFNNILKLTDYKPNYHQNRL